MPCTKTMKRRTGDVVGSGCRTDCLHRAMVETYREVKMLSDQTRMIDRENETMNHPTEAAEYDAAHPPVTFKAYLTANAQPEPQPAPLRWCAICGEPEGGIYAKPCCDDDQMLEG